ncbi:MAG: hypothetical protein JXR64_13980, partial [Spirochaetales bacterium]|nr:hypothetical protein [Spirochaetales bacterium]
MKSRTKIIISLSLSFLIYTFFIFFSFSSGFSIIENKFYSKKIGTEISLILSKSLNLLEEFNTNNFKEIDIILNNEYISNVTESIFTPEEILGRDKIVKQLKTSIKGFDYLRIISLDGKKLQYSNLSTDIRSKDSTKISYFNVNQISDNETLNLYTIKNKDDKKIIFLEDANQFLYVIPFIDKYDRLSGVAYFYISLSGFRNIMSSLGYISSTEEAYILSSNGIIFNLSRTQFNTVKNDVNKYWNSSDPINQIYLSDSSEDRYILFTEHKDGVGSIGRIIPAKELELSKLMKFLLLITLFIVILFTNFILLNIKQDKSVILQNRIKKFQIKFLQDYVESKSEIDWNHWQDEISS